MKHIANGVPETDQDVLHTTGYAELVAATDNGALEHTGNAARAQASHGGRVLLRGMEIEELSASDHGSLYCHGSPTKVSAAHFGSVAVYGNPLEVYARDNASVIVFGMPDSVSAARAHVTIVDIDGTGALPKLHTGDHGSVSILSEGVADTQPPRRHLEYALEQLFPEGGGNPEYTAALHALKTFPLRYLRSETDVR